MHDKVYHVCVYDNLRKNNKEAKKAKKPCEHEL